MPTSNSEYHIDDIISLVNEIKKSDDDIFKYEAFELISNYITANEDIIFKPISQQQNKLIEALNIQNDLAEFVKNSQKKEEIWKDNIEKFKEFLNKDEGTLNIINTSDNRV